MINSFFLTLLIKLLLDGVSAQGNINEGASTSKSKNDLSEEEKREITAYSMQFLRLFVSYYTFNRLEYYKFEHQVELRPKSFDHIPVYADLEKRIYNLLKYGQKDSINKRIAKLLNSKARKHYYEEEKNKMLESLWETPECTDFLGNFETIRNIGTIALTTDNTTKVPSTMISTTTTIPKKSLFKRFYERCKKNL